jgi:hypothetical protein
LPAITRRPGNGCRSFSGSPGNVILSSYSKKMEKLIKKSLKITIFKNEYFTSNWMQFIRNNLFLK